MSEKRKKRETGDGPEWMQIAIIGAIVVVAVIVVGWNVGGKYVYGATPAQVSTVSLAATPKQLGKALPATTVDSSSVRARFKVGSARPYEWIEFDWNSDSQRMPYSIEIRPESEKAEDEEEHGATVIAALGRPFHALRDGQWRWGGFEIRARDDGRVTTHVDPVRNGKPNPLFERQMDAARQVALEAAFGIAPRATDAELAELLGTGYRIADVGKVEPRTTIDEAPAVMQSRFAGSIHDDSSSWKIAIDHPLVDHVTLDWENAPGGHLRNVSIYPTQAYETNRDTFEACIANLLGPPQAKTTDYAAAKKDYVFPVGSFALVLEQTRISLRGPRELDGAVLAKIFDAFGSCHEKTENTGSRGDGRKK